MAELIVITGGAYAGKTSVVTELAARGCATLPEAAIEIIDELNAEHGIKGQMAWRRANEIAFQRRITERQHAREVLARAREAPYVFCDRALLDGWAYCRFAGVDWADDLRILAANARYAHVFVLETLTPFEPRRDSGRIDTHEGSREVAAILTNLYTSHAETITHVPQVSVAERVDLVLRTLACGE